MRPTYPGCTLWHASLYETDTLRRMSREVQEGFLLIALPGMEFLPSGNLVPLAGGCRRHGCAAGLRRFVARRGGERARLTPVSIITKGSLRDDFDLGTLLFLRADTFPLRCFGDGYLLPLCRSLRPSLATLPSGCPVPFARDALRRATASPTGRRAAV